MPQNQKEGVNQVPLKLTSHIDILISLQSGVLGAWMTFKKAEMAKTLNNGLSMSKTDPFNHKWLDFAI